MSLLRKWSHLVRFVISGSDGLKGYPVGAGKWIVYGKGQRHVIRLRANTADFNVFRHIFVDPAYSFRRLHFNNDLARRYERILARGRNPLIIDCGANNGCSALWFKFQYPKARVVAVEPEESNFLVLSINVEGANVEAFNRAVHSCNVSLSVVASGDETAFRTIDAVAGARSIASITIPELVSDEDDLFIVKIDIEGFEHDLFAANTGWVDDTDLIVMELHDHLFAGQAHSRPFFEALMRSAPRDFTHRGENIFSLKTTQ